VPWRNFGALWSGSRRTKALTNVAPATRDALLETLAALEQHALR